MSSTPVYLEIGAKRVFAVALGWPGWARSGRTPEAALDALTTYASRYAPVAARAGHPLTPEAGVDLEVVEEVPGDATTDFGAPGKVPQADRAPVTAVEAGRLADLVGAAWATIDEIAADAPPALRKGPRGGGRDRDAVVQHVLAAEASYARKVGVRLKEPRLGDVDAVEELRAQVRDALRAGSPEGPKAWPVRYAAQRIAWHVLDHAWEIEDKSG
jgi:hypothetical protein